MTKEKVINWNVNNKLLTMIKNLKNKMESIINIIINNLLMFDNH